jgi:hypothetical protein
MLREKIADRHEKIADRHDWGLKLVHDGSLEGKPKDPERLDIVLVHGLGGHRETTWTAEDGSYWATNFPPPFTSNLRVFTFGYSGTPRSTGNKETVLSIAENLLELLSDERKQPHLKRRPLIWAGHNLGGNIIKQVLVETERPTSRHHEVYRSTAGVVSGCRRTPPCSGRSVLPETYRVFWPSSSSPLPTTVSMRKSSSNLSSWPINTPGYGSLETHQARSSTKWTRMTTGSMIS